MNSPILIK